MRPIRPGELGFCPFCKQAFEDGARCPDHDLALVPAHLLPRSREDADAEVVPLLAVGRGRLLVLVGALAVLTGFLAPNFVDGAGRLGPKSGLATAVSTAPVLWLVPAAGALLASFSVRRTRHRDLRRARLGLLGLAIIAAVVELYVVHRVGVAELVDGRPASIGLGVGVPLVLLGAALAGLGALLLGRGR